MGRVRGVFAVKDKIERMEHVPATADDGWIYGAEVVGRMRLFLKGGGIVDALLIERLGTNPGMRVVYLNRERGTFETVEVTPYPGVESHGLRRG